MLRFLKFCRNYKGFYSFTYVNAIGHVMNFLLFQSSNHNNNKSLEKKTAALFPIVYIDIEIHDLSIVS